MCTELTTLPGGDMSHLDSETMPALDCEQLLEQEKKNLLLEVVIFCCVLELDSL